MEEEEEGTLGSERALLEGLLNERKGGSVEDDLMRYAVKELAQLGVDRGELASMLQNYDYDRV